MRRKLTDRMGRPVKHGWNGTPEHRAWGHMKDRCFNPRSQRYGRYGARGIAVCDRWKESFLAFIEDVGPRPSPKHSLERVNNNGHYEPGNVVWAEREQQANNKSTSVILEFRGESLSVNQWARRLGICNRTIGMRLNAGWSIEKTLTTPAEHRNWAVNPGRRVMTPEKAKEIRERVRNGERQAGVAKSCGVSQSLVSKVVRNQIWTT